MRIARAGRPAMLAMSLVFALPANAQEGCAQPRDWRRVYPQPGQPREEVDACLPDKAWTARHLKIPLQSATAGIVAQCEVEVIFFEGPQGSDARFRAQREIDAEDRDILGEAAGLVTHYRACLGG